MLAVGIGHPPLVSLPYPWYQPPVFHPISNIEYCLEPKKYLARKYIEHSSICFSGENMLRTHKDHEAGENRTPRRRRLLLKFGIILLALFLGRVLHSLLIKPVPPQVTYHEVSIPNLPPEFDGFKIVQLSDLHIGLWIRPKHVRSIVKQVNALDPDVVLMTGDFVSITSRYIEPSIKELSGLRTRNGVFAVLGNHDYWTDAARVTDTLQKSGVDVLFDESRRIEAGDKHIRLLGFDDAWEGNPDYQKPFEGIQDRDVCLAMAHNPDAILSLHGKPVNLLISGHTHGGLINLPYIGPVFCIGKLPRKYSSGMFTFGDTRLYVSRGIGSGTIACVRFRCPPEIPVFVLRRVEN